MPLTDIERSPLAALDEQKLIGALRDLLRIPSVTGQEAAAQRRDVAGNAGDAYIYKQAVSFQWAHRCRAGR